MRSLRTSYVYRPWRTGGIRAWQVAAEGCHLAVEEVLHPEEEECPQVWDVVVLVLVLVWEEEVPALEALVVQEDQEDQVVQDSLHKTGHQVRVGHLKANQEVNRELETSSATKIHWVASELFSWITVTTTHLELLTNH